MYMTCEVHQEHLNIYIVCHVQMTNLRRCPLCNTPRCYRCNNLIIATDPNRHTNPCGHEFHGTCLGQVYIRRVSSALRISEYMLCTICRMKEQNVDVLSAVVSRACAMMLLGF